MKFTRNEEGTVYTITFEPRAYTLDDLEWFKRQNDAMLSTDRKIHIVYEAANFQVPSMSVLMPLVWYMLSKRSIVSEVVNHTTIRCTANAKRWFDRLFIFYKPTSPYSFEIADE